MEIIHRTNRGALINGKYILPFFAKGGCCFICPQCQERVIKSSRKDLKYFKHLRKGTCAYYDIEGGESAEHRDSKLFIEWYLSKYNLDIDYCICSDCSKYGIFEYKYKRENEVKLEYRVENGTVDVAVIQKGQIILIIEVCKTHKTTKPRPEPWFEVTTSEITKLKVMLSKGKWEENSSTPKLNCSRIRECNDCMEKLNTEQKKAIKMVLEGKNVFISGPAGTGKSYIVEYLKRKMGANIEITSTTGISAINIDGKTIHSYLNIGTNKSFEETKKYILESEKTINKWRNIHSLLIDEISMLEMELFENIEELARYVRRCDEFFGGIQIICCGDFYQLPPVSNSSKYCFQSPKWEKIFPKENSVILTEIYRQSDHVFKNILNELRDGYMSKNTEEYLQKIYEKKLPDKEIIHLTAKNDIADKINTDKFNENKGNECVYEFVPMVKKMYVNYHTLNRAEKFSCTRKYSNGALFEEQSEFNMLPNFVQDEIPNKLLLYKNLRVILTKNEPLPLIDIDIDIVDENCDSTEYNKLANGSMGKIKDFIKCPIFSDKKQGAGVDGEHRILCPIVEFDSKQTVIITPVVKIVDKLICEETKTYEYYRLIYFPLKLAYAITIHKSQGMTLEDAVVDLGVKTFSAQQVYVGLSRLRKSEGLYFKSLSIQKIKNLLKETKPIVHQFYKNLEY